MREHHLHGPFVGAAHDAEFEGAALRPLECIEQVVDTADRLARGCHDQVARGEAGAGGGTVFGYLVDEQPFGVGQADGAAQPPGYLTGGDGDAKLRWRR